MYEIKLKLYSGETKTQSFESIYALGWFLYCITEDTKLQRYFQGGYEFMAWDGVSFDGDNQKVFHEFSNHKKFINFCLAKYGSSVPGDAALTINGKENYYFNEYLVKTDRASQIWQGLVQKFSDKKYNKTIKFMEKQATDLKKTPGKLPVCLNYASGRCTIKDRPPKII